MITGSTKLLPLVGHPVAQVKSPPLFNAHFVAAGLDAVIVPVDLGPRQIDGFFAMMRDWHNSLGCSVTVPHKQRALVAVDRATERAELAGAVNIIRREADGSLSGDMTDGLAMVAALRAKGFDPAGRHALIAGGGGGAGSAIVLALCEAGLQRLTVLEGDADRARRIAETVARSYPHVSVRHGVREASDIDLILNASPLGMRETDPLPVDPTAFSAKTFAADVVTAPEETPFIARARRHGMTVVTGLDMIDCQLPFQMAHLGIPGLPETTP